MRWTAAVLVGLAAGASALNGTCPSDKKCGASAGSSAGLPCCQITEETYECCFSSEACIPNVGCRCAARGSLDEREVSLCDDVKQYAGYYRLTTGDKNYFYWAFESRNDPSTDPVVLWMTGGPGCSSEVALFGENGPCKVNADGASTTSNPYSWNSNATLIYIDQPTGTGFSYGKDYDHNETGVAVDMYDFLQQFFKAHPSLQKLPFYIFGESYAGHYVPAVSHKVWAENQKLASGAIAINLKGVSVGNGLTDPEVQYKYYPDMAASTNNHSAALGAVALEVMRLAVPGCTKAITACQTDQSACTGALEKCNLALVEPYQLTGLNPYDMRIKCAKPPLCYDFSSVATYLGRSEVKAALGVTGQSWSDCNMQVNQMFQGDWMHDYQQMLPDQLKSGIRVQIYAGDQDFICNWLGNKAWTLAMEWDGKSAFNAAGDNSFVVKGKEVGKVRAAKGFSFVQVYEAGHMVPMDQPEVALAMINEFIHQ